MLIQLPGNSKQECRKITDGTIQILGVLTIKQRTQNKFISNGAQEMKQKPKSETKLQVPALYAQVAMFDDHNSLEYQISHPTTQIKSQFCNCT